MNKEELEKLLDELDEALIAAFPGPEVISCLVVGGACLVLAEITKRQTTDIDVIITDLMGSGEASLIYNLTPVTTRLRKIIGAIGRKHGLPRDKRFFLNDDAAIFLLEQGSGELPEMQLLRAYKKIHLFVPADLGYILACKIFAGRKEKDLDDIAVLRQRLGIETRAQAQRVVNQFFPDFYQQFLHQVPRMLQQLFPEE